MSTSAVLYLTRAASPGEDVLSIDGVGSLAPGDVIELWTPGCLAAERCKVGERTEHGIAVHRAQEGSSRAAWPVQTPVLVATRVVGPEGRLTCQACGALVGDRALHVDWHFTLDRASRRPW